MTLNEYFTANPEVTQKGFADKVICSQVFVSLMLSGARKPSLDLAFRIEKETDGAVPADSWATAA